MKRLIPEGTERHFKKTQNVVSIERMKIFQCYFFLIGAR